MTKPINIFISYVDDDRELFLELIGYLTQLSNQHKQIKFWREGEALYELPHPTWERDNEAVLEKANIILLCLSKAYLYDNEVEITDSYKLAKQNNALVIPILLRECNLTGLFKETIFPIHGEFGELEVTSPKWGSLELAFESILKEVQKAIFKTEEFFNFKLNDQKNAVNTTTQFSSNINTIVGEQLQIGRDLNQTSFVFGEGAHPTFLVNESLGFSPSQPILNNELIMVALWERIPFKEVIEPRTIIKLDRDIEFDNILRDDLLDNFGIESNLYYFVCGCYTQRPDDLAKRIIHVFFDEDLILDYAKTSNTNLIDDIATFDLKFGLTEKKSWSFFWQIIKKALPVYWCKMFALEDNHKVLSEDELQQQFDKFKETIIVNIAQHRRYPIILKIAKNIWSRSLESHIEYIIRKFSEIPTQSQKFVLIFVFELTDLHNCRNTESHPILSFRNRIKSLKERMIESRFCQHLLDVEIMDYISEDDLFTWFKTLLRDDNDKERIPLKNAWEYFLTILFKEMVEEERESAKQKKYDMDRLLSIQNKIYQRTKQMQ